jgi:phosphoserine phosphatase
MKVIKSTKTVFFDVDETLLVFNHESAYPTKELVAVKNQKSGTTAYAMPHCRHIALMQEFKARGHTVVVWSQGGSAWAAQAVRLLKLESHVDYAMGKPDWYVDDKHASAFMPNPIYLDCQDPHKDHRGWGDEEDEN